MPHYLEREDVRIIKLALSVYVNNIHKQIIVNQTMGIDQDAEIIKTLERYAEHAQRLHRTL